MSRNIIFWKRLSLNWEKANLCERSIRKTKYIKKTAARNNEPASLWTFAILQLKLFECFVVTAISIDVVCVLFSFVFFRKTWKVFANKNLKNEKDVEDTHDAHIKKYESGRILSEFWWPYFCFCLKMPEVKYLCEIVFQHKNMRKN